MRSATLRYIRNCNAHIYDFDQFYRSVKNYCKTANFTRTIYLLVSAKMYKQNATNNGVMIRYLRAIYKDNILYIISNYFSTIISR